MVFFSKKNIVHFYKTYNLQSVYQQSYQVWAKLNHISDIYQSNTRITYYNVGKNRNFLQKYSSEPKHLSFAGSASLNCSGLLLCAALCSYHFNMFVYDAAVKYLLTPTIVSIVEIFSQVNIYMLLHKGIVGSDL